MLTSPTAVLVALTLVVFAAVLLEEWWPLARSLGAALLAMLAGMALSNAGVLPGASGIYDFLTGPGESGVYDFLTGRGVSVGIALVLLRVDIGSVRAAGPRMLWAFGIGAAGTAVGATLAALLLAPRIGDETWKLAGQYTGTYIGGGVNFAALGQAFETSSHLFSAAVAADVIVTALWMMACLAAPVIAGAARVERPPAIPVSPTGEITLERALHTSGRAVSIRDTAALVAIAISVVGVSDGLATLPPGLPAVLWLTTIVLGLGQLGPIKRLSGSAVFGNYLVLLFLAANGAQSVVQNIAAAGPGVFYFALITVAVHGTTIFGLGRLAGLDLPTLAVASQANVGGAASAMAMASARGYADRLLPGVAVGLLGYALGNYGGLAIGGLVRALL